MSTVATSSATVSSILASSNPPACAPPASLAAVLDCQSARIEVSLAGVAGASAAEGLDPRAVLVPSVRSWRGGASPERPIALSPGHLLGLQGRYLGPAAPLGMSASWRGVADAALWRNGGLSVRCDGGVAMPCPSGLCRPLIEIPLSSLAGGDRQGAAGRDVAEDFAILMLTRRSARTTAKVIATTDRMLDDLLALVR